MIPKEIINNVRRIEIRTKSILDAILAGEYRSVFKGKGMEFSEVRTYTDGDDIRSIDWNVTARMGEPYIKKNVEERELTVMLMLDASASGSFGSQEKYKDEIAVELSALLAFSAIKNNDRVGLIIFTDEVEKYIPPKKGKNHVLRCIREMLYFKPTRKGTNIAVALEYLTKVQTKRSVVFIVSDFMATGYESAFRICAKRHDCIAIIPSDVRETNLPKSGFVQIQDAESGEYLLIDLSDKHFHAAYTKATEKRKEELFSFLRSNIIDRIEISTSGDYVDPLVRFFRKRERMSA